MNDPSDLPGDLVPLFADLAERFGIARPAGQILGLMYLTPVPICADDMVTALRLSRSNVSTALKELRDWSLIGQVTQVDDRRSFYTAPSDAWTLLHKLTLGRARRETQPALSMLRALSPHPDHPDSERKIRKLQAALTSISAAQEHLAQLPPDEFGKLVATLSAQKKKKKIKTK